VTEYRIEAEPSIEADVEASFDWYEDEQIGLGFEFLDQLRAAYLRILDGPFKYVELRSGIRRALTKRFHMQFTFQSKGRLLWSLPFFIPQETPPSGSVGLNEVVTKK
jgi:glycosyltransferase involved in cell wall biosynthesis